MRTLIQTPTSLLVAGLALLSACGPGESFVDEPAEDVPRYDNEYPFMDYSGSRTTDPITALGSAVARGDVSLEHDVHRGYLDSLLQALGIDVASQMLVFSKTSLQIAGIHSTTPRAIYFNDNTYVAWIQEAKNIEIASMDPQLGPVFHTLDQRPDVDPRFNRQTRRCLECHDSLSLTGGGVPRFITGSGYTGTAGELVSHEGRILTSDRTPLRSRWGGWYVSGHHGDQVHLGNIVVGDIAELQDLEGMRIGNLEDLDSLLDTSRYLNNKSDIVALLVLEHQVTVQNAITRCSWDTRRLLYDTEQGDATADNNERIASIAEPLVEALFRVNAGRITGRISGTSGFAEQFAARGPRDKVGRSLRELDLRTRLFKYPLSYVIYSAAFDALPEVIRNQVYRRIAAVLRGEDGSGSFDHLTAEDRTAIDEILRETRPEFSAALVK